jgi:hypothetical protein
MTGLWSVKLPKKCGIRTLQTHHEGTNHVKVTRIDIGLRKFELFKMKENVWKVYNHYNELNSFGKILRCLPKVRDI